MDSWELRPMCPGDRPRLAALWQDAFGDDGAYIDAFYSLFGCRGVMVQADGRPVSAMYVMDGVPLAQPGMGRCTGAYTFALATDRAYRGRGMGKAVYRAAVDAALARDDGAFVLPAEESLYPFYSGSSGAVPAGAVREAVLSRGDLTGHSRVPVLPLGPAEYAARREALLSDLPHAVMPESFLALEAYQMGRFGGGFFAAGRALAAVETAGSTCRIIELLDPAEDGMAALAALAGLFPAERFLVRSPLFFGGPGEARHFMLAVSRTPLFSDLWWGFAFD